MPRPFAVIGFTVFFTSVILFNSDIGVTVGFLAVYAVALVVSLILSSSRKQKVLPCAFASGILACILLISEISFNYQPAVEYAGNTCNISAQLTDYPEFRYGNYYYDAETIEIDGQNTEQKLRLVFSSYPDAEPYDVIEGDFTFYLLGSSNEESLASNKANGVFIGAYPDSWNYRVVKISESEKPFMKTVVDARQYIKNIINKAVPGDAGALTTALIIGDKSNLSSDIQNDFRRSGITHIICVSGFHLSLWAMFILEILKLFKIKESIASVISIVGVIAFMLVAGMTYSVVRSGIMMVLYLLANVLWKKRDSLNSLGFALTVIAVYNPFAMGSVALQLSALASLGLILFSQNVKPKIDAHLDKIKDSRISDILKKFVSALCVPIVASLFTLPVSIGLYDEFNFAVFATNLIAVPVSSICIFTGALAALMCAVAPTIPDIFAYSTEFFTSFLMKIARLFGEFDLLTFRADSDVHSVMLCGILLVCAVSVFITFAGRNVFKVACSVCIVILVCCLAFSSVTIENETRITVIDVGNGTAVLASKNGENLLIGCGGTAFMGAENISDVITRYGGKTNTIIVSDNEYSSGFLNEILLNYRPTNIFLNELPSGSELLLGGCNIYDFGDEYESLNFKFRTYGNDVVFVGSDDATALICFNPVFDYSLLPEEFKRADIIIARNDYPNNIQTDNCRLLVVNSENSRGIAVQKELSEHGIRGVATAGCGNILIRAENGFVSAERTE